MATDHQCNSTTPTEEGRQFVVAVVAAYGATLRRSASGRPELNLASMSRILARRLRLVWDVDLHEFMVRQADQTYAPVSPAYVLHIVGDALQRIAALQPELFPMKELRPARIDKLVAAIKIAAPWQRPDTQDGLQRFIRERLCLKSGGSVSSQELHAAYVLFSTEHRLQMMPWSVFSREVVRSVFRVFTKTPSHSLLRRVAGTTKQTSRNGYKGICLVGERGDAGDVGFTNPS
jgi:hypothetical protein